jgi:DNA-binding NarL/FixJ family response regulator
VSIAVAIVEDIREVRAIIAEWIRSAEGFRLTGEHSNVESALAHLPQERPDVVLLDINLAGRSGLECLRQLKPVMPETQFVMVTVFEDSDHVFDALTAGASGYLLKQVSRDELLAAVRQVHDGGAPMSSYIARKVVNWFQAKQTQRSPAPEHLSEREREILRLLARGDAYKEIADTLGVSLGTINTHVRRIYRKLHVSSRSAAVSLFAPFPSEPRAPDGPTL